MHALDGIATIVIRHRLLSVNAYAYAHQRLSRCPVVNNAAQNGEQQN